MKAALQRIEKLLLWSQKYTHTDMLYLAKGGFWLTLGQIISNASSFLLAIAFANLLPVETFGTYRYVLSMASILAIPTLEDMDTAVIQATAKGYEGSLRQALRTKLRWGSLGSLAGLITAGYYFLSGNHALTISFLIVAVFLPFYNSFNIYFAFLYGKEKFDTSTKYNVVSQVVSIGSLVAALFLTNNLLLVLLAYFLPWTVMRYLFLKLTIKSFLPNQASEDPGVISYGKHLSLAGAINTVAVYLDKVLIFHYLGAVQVAVYHFATVIPDRIKSPFEVTNKLALPKFAQRDFQEIKKTIWKKISIYFLILVSVVILYIVAAPFIFHIFFPAYADSVKFSQVFAISLIMPQMILHSVLVAHKKTKEIYIVDTLGSLFLIIFLVLGALSYGLWGIIFARLAHRFVYGAILTIFFQKIT